MAYIAQDQATQSHIKSFRLTTADTRESRRDDAKRNNTYYKKENRLAMSKSEASFTLGSVIGQVVPVNGAFNPHFRFWSDFKLEEFADEGDRTQCEDST